MKSKRAKNLIGVTVFGIILVIAVMAFRLIPTSATVVDGPPNIGEMRNFELTKWLIERPEISWKDAAGKNISLADFDGKIVLLNYWASWCAPCLRELPSLDRLAAKYNSTDFEVVALNVDKEGKSLAQKTATQLKLRSLKLNLDPDQATYQVMGVRAMPSTFLVDRSGNILGIFRGAAEWDSDAAVKLFKFFIENPNYAAGLKSRG